MKKAKKEQLSERLAEVEWMLRYGQEEHLIKQKFILAQELYDIRLELWRK